jgi:hypothetical protein
MPEYKVIFPKPDIESRAERDFHHDKLEELLQEILREQERVFEQLKKIEGR